MEDIKVKAWSDPPKNSKAEVDYGPAGWGGLLGGLLIGWFAWHWLDPRYPILLTAVWTFLAVGLGGIAVRGVLKALGSFGRFFARNAADGWRESEAKHAAKQRPRQPSE